MKNILVTSAGGAGAMDLAKTLATRYAVFLADASDAVHEQYPNFPFQKIPFGSDPGYKAAVKALITQSKIDCVFPGSDDELLPCSELRDDGRAACVTPSSTFIAACLDKKNLMTVLHAKNISHLPPFASAEAVTYPAFAKPIRGRGSRGIHKLERPEQLEGYLKLFNTPFDKILVHPFAGGQEYTVSVIVNNKNKIIGIVPKIVLEKRGLTLAAITERNATIEKTCQRIVDEMNPCGPFNVQMMLDHNECFVFEINPRLSSTAVLTEKAFGNEVDLYIRYFDQEIINDAPQMKEGVRFSRVYIQEAQ